MEYSEQVVRKRLDEEGETKVEDTHMLVESSKEWEHNRQRPCVRKEHGVIMM